MIMNNTRLRMLPGENIAALETISDAYMALAGLPDANPLAWDDGPASPLMHLRRAFLTAARRAGLTHRQSRQVFTCVVGSGTSVAYALGHLVSHPDAPEYI